MPLNLVGSLASAGRGADAETVARRGRGLRVGPARPRRHRGRPAVEPRAHPARRTSSQHAWSAGATSISPTLVGQVQQPPIRKLGVFELDTFFPPTDRTALAHAAQRAARVAVVRGVGPGRAARHRSMLLTTDDGKPRCAIVTIAHLSDERAPVRRSSLLLGKLVTWMRRQTGTTDLRAIVYMDEVAGYAAAHREPADRRSRSSRCSSRRGRSASASCSSTQNPVDLDYKAISNAGTWMVGRLQTEQDKARLLDGMTAAARRRRHRRASATRSAGSASVSSCCGARASTCRPCSPPVGRWPTSAARSRASRSRRSRPTMRPSRCPRRRPASLLRTFRRRARPALPATDASPGRTEGRGQHPHPLPRPRHSVGSLRSAPVAGGDAPRRRRGRAGEHPVRRRQGRAATSRRSGRRCCARCRRAPTRPLRSRSTTTSETSSDGHPPAALYAVPEAPVGTKTYWTSLQRNLVDQLVRTRTMRDQSQREAQAVLPRRRDARAVRGSDASEAADALADQKLASVRDKYAPAYEQGPRRARRGAQDKVEVQASRRRRPHETTASSARSATCSAGSSAGRSSVRTMSRSISRSQGRASTANKRLDEREEPRRARSRTRWPTSSRSSKPTSPRCTPRPTGSRRRSTR